MWKDAIGYPNYEVSKSGVVRNKISKVILVPFLSNRGYLRVNLRRDGVKCKASVHRLVAEAYVPNTCNYNEVNHKNNKRTDNRACNLEWCNRSINQQQVWDKGAFKKKRRKS